MSARAVDTRARRRRKRGARQGAWDALGVAIFVVMVFPVFWMISTAFKPDDQINSLTPTWFSLQPTLHHFRDAMHQPFFWNDVVNTLIIVGVTVVVSMTLAFLAAVALAKYRFTGRKLFIVIVIGDPDDPRRRTDHPALRRTGALPPGQRAERRDHRLRVRRAAVQRLDAARLHARHSEGPRRSRDGGREHDGSAPSYAFSCRSSRRVSLRHRCSRSSRRGTSTSSPGSS